MALKPPQGVSVPPPPRSSISRYLRDQDSSEENEDPDKESLAYSNQIPSRLEYGSEEKGSTSPESPFEEISFGDTMARMVEFFKWDCSQLSKVQRRYYELIQLESARPSAVPPVLSAVLDAFSSASQDPDSHPPLPKKPDQFY